MVSLGNLGRALLKYGGFRSRRFHIVAVFDNDPHKVGQTHEGLRIEPLESLRKAVAAHKISLGLLCVPADAAQRVVDLMVTSGVTDILNFTPVPLWVPPSVHVAAVDLSVQLENLAYKVQTTQTDVYIVG
ncbi:MAG: redox-sensing transcriptional repressor Rex [Planctomycetaceae bacterium]|nr:redox-sensing transcriptional repressor Rex [Planctomycetaceae bacterium]